MSRFVLTAQLKLQAPRNTQQVLNQLRNELKGVSVPVELKGAKKAQQQAKQVKQELDKANNSARDLGRSFGLAVKRFAAFTVASRAVSLFTNSLANAVNESIDFQREVIKIAQVTGKTVKELKSLQQTINSLSVNLGTSSKELLSTARILSQAGVKANDLNVALQALAKTTLAPTFDDITQTAEGAVAILRQFEQGVGRLESQLGSINAVAGQFAVESADLIGAVRRFGGVFKSAGGSLEELLAIFTSVRATTRESAESISTGLRTIFTRIQRPATIQFLKNLGVELTDLNGRFVGPFEAAKRLSEAFGGLQEGDIKFVQIAEELGGFRQIGKVIPLLREFATAQEALKAAQAGQSSLTEDAITAQQALAVQITKVKEEFLALVRSITASTSFQAFAKTALSLASALIKVADALSPLLPLLAGFAAFKIGSNIGPFLGGVGGALKGVKGKNQGGRIYQFARGGFVPGQGNRDTVPAMLTPGEFVIKKSSAKKLGAGTLQRMNENKFAGGGLVVRQTDNDQYAGLFARPRGEDQGGKPLSIAPNSKQENKVGNKKVLGILGAPRSYFISGVDEDTFTEKAESALRRGVNETVSKLTVDKKKINKVAPAILEDIGVKDIAGKIFEGVTRTVIGANKKGDGSQQSFDIPSEALSDEAVLSELSNLFSAQEGLKKINYDNKLTEDSDSRRSLISKAVTKKLYSPNDLLITSFSNSISTEDLAGGNQQATLLKPKATDKDRELARRRATRLAELDRGIANVPKLIPDTDSQDLIINRVKKEKSLLTKKGVRSDTGKKTQKANKGGSIGGSGDTVPALLTPGEFVVNKKAAQSIGYSNLASMNKSGVARFAKGGAVGGVQMLNSGGVAGGVGGFAAAGQSVFFLAQGLTVLTAVVTALTKAGEKATLAEKKREITAQAAIKVFVALVGGVIFYIQTTKKINEWVNKAGKSIQKLGDEAEKSSSKEGNEAKKDADVKKEEQKKEKKTTEEKGKITERQSKEERKALRRKAEGKLAQKGPTERKGDASKGLVAVQRKILASREKIKTQATKLINAERKLQAQRERFNQNAPREAGRYTKRTAAQQKEAAAAQKQIIILKQVVEARKANIQAEVAARNKLQGAVAPLTNELREQTAIVNKLEAKENQLAANRKKSAERQIQGQRKLFDRVKRTIQVFKSQEQVTKNAAGAETRLSKIRRNSIAVTKTFGSELERARTKVRKLGSDLKKSFSTPGGRVRRGIGAAGRAGAGLSAVGIIGTQAAAAIGGAVTQFARETEQRATKKGNVAGSIKAAQGGAISEGATDLLTNPVLLAGALFSPNIRKGFFANLKSRAATRGAEAGISTVKARGDIVSERFKEGKFASADGSTNFGAATDFLSQGLGDARAAIAKTEGVEREKLTNELNKSLVAQVQNFAKLGATEQELVATANQLGKGNEELRKKLLDAAKAAIAQREAARALAKANIDSLKITSAFSAAATAAASFGESAKTGAGALDGYIQELENARNSVGVDASNAINAIEADLLKNAGGADTALGRSIKGQADQARATADFSKAIGSQLSAGAIRFNSKETAKADIEGILEKAIPANASAATKRQLRKVISANVEGISDEDFATTDISALVQKIAKESQALSNGFFEAAKIQAQHNATMGKLYAEREQLEQKVAETLNSAIDLQLQASEIFASFGGAKLTAGQKLDARVAQFNNVGGLAGVGLGSGSADDIKRVGAELGAIVRGQNTAQLNDIATRAASGQAGGGVFAGAEGIVADRRDEAKIANDALIKFTQQRIALLKEELNIVKQKNAAEKKSLDSLISGDIAGFLKEQGTAGAAAALRSGDAGLTGLFSAQALGRGLKSLEGQGLSDQQLSSAENLTLNRFGLQGSGVLTGTTQEEQRLKAEGRALSGALGDLAGQSAEFAKADLTIKQAVINATELRFRDTLTDVSERNAGQRLAKGGIVYASRGMFVPRGTDTVPAMLTPGEFVVNRAAVRRGNNLQMLQAMNSGGNGGGASGPGHMSGGGQVGYYALGGLVDSIGKAFGDAIPQLQGFVGDLAQSISNLANTTLAVDVGTTNVNVNFNGTSFLSSLEQSIKTSLLEEVTKEIEKFKLNDSGDLVKRESVL